MNVFAPMTCLELFCSAEITASGFVEASAVANGMRSFNVACRRRGDRQNRRVYATVAISSLIAIDETFDCSSDLANENVRAERGLKV